MESIKYIFKGLSLRLDKFLSQQDLGISRSKICDLVSLGKVSVNGKVIRKRSFLLASGDVIEIERDSLRAFTTTLSSKRGLEAFGSSGDGGLIVPERIILNVLYEDDDILVLDKSSGMVVHPGINNYSGTLVNALAYYLSKKKVKPPKRVGLVHRLDKEVSGLMVIAKNDISLEVLSGQFSSEARGLKATKTYWAVVETSKLLGSNIGRDFIEIKGYISRKLNDRRKMEFRYYDGGVKARSAISRMKLVKKGRKYSIVEVELVTGRTHQIRSQLEFLGIPIINDVVYGGKKIKGMRGIGLRSVKLKIIHPRVYRKVFKSGKNRIRVENGKKKGTKYMVFESKEHPVFDVV